ncbi:MAG TPA: SemiSWEET family transporter [Conexibacter sp.]|nr:SemiSWEET family transporter [Conexibacter sp.]
MTLASLVGPVAAAMGVLMALSPLLQARRIRIVHDSSEVSSGVFIVMRVNASAWLLYGFATANVILIVPNLVALITTTATLFVIRRHRPAVAPATPPDAPPRDIHAGRIRGSAASVARAGRRLAFARR